MTAWLGTSTDLGLASRGRIMGHIALKEEFRGSSSGPYHNRPPSPLVADTACLESGCASGIYLTKAPRIARHERSYLLRGRSRYLFRKGKPWIAVTSILMRGVRVQAAGPRRRYVIKKVPIVWPLAVRRSSVHFVLKYELCSSQDN